MPTPVEQTVSCELADLAGCDRELALRICSAQLETVNARNGNWPLDAAVPIDGRDRVYLFGTVLSQDPRDVDQLQTLMGNLKTSIAAGDLEAVPPPDREAFEPGPVIPRDWYDRSPDALLIVNS